MKFFLSFLFFYLSFFSQELPFKNFTVFSPINPLPYGDVTSILQDKKGYMWFSNFTGGVLRYDGVRIDLFNTNNGLRSNNSLFMAFDKFERLWVLADNSLDVSSKPVSEYESRDSIKFISAISSLKLKQHIASQISAHSLIADRDGNIWVGTVGDGIYFYKILSKDSVSEQHFTSVDKNPIKDIYCILADNDGRLIFSAEGELYIYANNKFTRTDLLHKKLQANIHGMTQLKNGSYLFGSANGDVILIENLLKPSDYKLIKKLDGNTVYTIKELANKNIWLTAFGDGVYILDQDLKVINHLNRESGLASDLTRRIFSDAEENIWISSAGGISKLPNNFETLEFYFPKANGYSMPILNSLTIHGFAPRKKDNNSFYIAHSQGISYFESNKVAHIGKKEGLNNSETYDVLRDQSGTIWLGSFSGVGSIEYGAKSNISPYKKKDVKPAKILDRNAIISYFPVGIAGAVYSFPVPNTVGKNNEAIFFESYNQIMVYYNKKWFIFSSESGVPEGIIYSICMDDSNFLYLGSGQHGLFKSKFPLTDKSMSSLEISGDDRIVLSSVFVSKDLHYKDVNFTEIKDIIFHNNYFWIAPSEGLLVFDRDLKTVKINLQLDDGLPNRFVMSLNVSPSTDIVWAGLGNGMVGIDPIQFTITKSINKKDGLISDEIGWLEGIESDVFGNIYMGTTYGFSIYKPHLEKINDTKPKTDITHFTFIDKGNGNNELYCEYASLSFANESSNLFKTKLVGFDDDFSAETSESKIRYTNLSAFFFPKTYQLEVLSSNNNGIWSSEPAIRTLVIYPPWFLTWWSMIIYTIIIILIYLFIKWLIKNWQYIIARKTSFIGHYKVLEQIGKGGIGTVYKAFDTTEKKLVALKVFEQSDLQNENFLNSFLKEVEIGQRLHHKNIVQLYNSSSSNNLRYIAMELIDGINLSTWIYKEELKTDLLIKTILKQILEGLKYIHDHNIVHRDLKAGNIMILKEDSIIKIMDFGLASAQLLVSLNERTKLVGTLAYMSPEQTIGKNVDKRSDIYSFGVILYEMLTKTMPYNAQNEMEMLFAIHNDSINFAGLEGNIYFPILKKCLEKNVVDRYQSVDEILSVLLKNK